MVKVWLDVTNATPTKGRGFYPTALCWEPQEGIFPGACQWTGQQWNDLNTSFIVAFIDEPFNNTMDAKAIASINNYETYGKSGKGEASNA